MVYIEKLFKFLIAKFLISDKLPQSTMPFSRKLSESQHFDGSDDDQVHKAPSAQTLTKQVLQEGLPEKMQNNSDDIHRKMQEQFSRH